VGVAWPAARRVARRSPRVGPEGGLAAEVLVAAGREGEAGHVRPAMAHLLIGEPDACGRGRTGHWYRARGQEP
jgi:hypothetical protein